MSTAAKKVLCLLQVSHPHLHPHTSPPLAGVPLWERQHGMELGTKVHVHVCPQYSSDDSGDTFPHYLSTADKF